ncbi:MAG: hypothetical protein PVG87_07775 [Desulfobacteraceae bacterium]|jgi:hypothetical protein
MAIHEAIVTLGVGDDDGGKLTFKTLFYHDGSPHSQGFKNSKLICGIFAGEQSADKIQIQFNK